MRRDRAADAADGHPVLRLRERSGQRDLEACVGVLAAVHKSDGYPVNWPSEPGGWLEGDDAFGAWVAELDGRVVGHVGLSRPGAGDEAPVLWGERAGVEGADATAVVSRLFVAPDARGHGIGALLMGRAVREARARGLHPVLDVVSTDSSAAALYERMGWQLLAVVEQEWEPGQRVALRCYAAPAE
ncbi:GNAT family N-acetyltransferase [Streptomyces sp. KL118A]|uniref:GNAT family N-acetyltransferase n=1 Tax=Streptomyces sp. KL118A TaxID=3045153 RepID=UPI00278C61CB|nr:GNAT family N-acetyltransferase [Streptomyces sp. KL118A]